MSYWPDFFTSSCTSSYLSMGFTGHRIIEYPELEGTRWDHQNPTHGPTGDSPRNKIPVITRQEEKGLPFYPLPLLFLISELKTACEVYREIPRDRHCPLAWEDAMATLERIPDLLICGVRAGLWKWETKIRAVATAPMLCNLPDRLVSLEGIYLVGLSVYQSHWSNKKTALWVQALNQAGNIALQLLLTQQEIHRSFSLHKPVCQERTIVNSFWFYIQESLLVSAATPVLPPYRAVQSELCTALSGCSSEIPGWPVCIMIYLQCFVYSH